MPKLSELYEPSFSSTGIQKFWSSLQKLGLEQESSISVYTYNLNLCLIVDMKLKELMGLYHLSKFYILICLMEIQCPALRPIKQHIHNFKNKKANKEAALEFCRFECIMLVIKGFLAKLKVVFNNVR